MRLNFKFIVLVLGMASVGAFGAPQIVTVGVEETLPGPAGRLPHIAIDGSGRPHVVADLGGQGVLYRYHKINGSWIWAQESYGGSQAYNPHIEINNFGQAWISCVRWYPEGMRMTLLDLNTATPTRLATTGTKGGCSCLPVSNLSLDPTIDNQAVVFGGNGGVFEIVNWSPGFTPGGIDTLNSGSGGEKNYFWISRAPKIKHNGIAAPQAVWHACTDWSYNNSVRAAADNNTKVWCAIGSYPAIGNDGAYPIVVGDSVEPETAYLMHGYGTGIILNIWKGTGAADGGGSFVRPASSLIVVDAGGTSGLRRFEPQLYPANNGGAWACYTAGSNIRLRYIPSDAQSSADLGPITQFPGALGAVAVDKEGNLHVTYLYGNRKYRKIAVVGDSLQPSGLIDLYVPSFSRNAARKKMLPVAASSTVSPTSGDAPALSTTNE